MSVTPGESKLPAEEYVRRRAFLESMTGLTRAEYMEIVRILQKHDTQYSENHNGIFLNLTTLSQEVFDALERFLVFTQRNRENLSDRDGLLSTLLVHSSTASSTAT